MSIDLIPLHHPDRDCFEDLIASFSQWAIRRHEMIYSESWKFCYLPSNIKSQTTIGEKLNIAKSDYLYLLEKYHGIKFTFCSCIDTDKAINIIQKQLEINYPIAIMIDSFWCPWTVNYQRIHSKGHVTFIVDFNKQDLKLYCTDPFYTVKEAQLPIDCFCRGYSGAYISFSLTKPEKEEIDWRNIIIESVSNLNKNDAFVNMRIFADDIVRTLDFSAETNGYDSSLVGVPLFEQLLSIGKGRLKYSLMLEFLVERYCINRLRDLSDAVRIAGTKWMTVRGILFKAYWSQHDADALSRAAGIINELSYKEEYISQRAMDIIAMKSESYSMHTRMESVEENDGLDSIGIEETFLVLSEYFNNKGFGRVEYTNSLNNADLTGNGKCFLSEGIPESKVLEVCGMKFILPCINEDVNDNISCKGQAIYVPDALYRGIMMLGCSDWGNYSDRIHVRYIDESSEYVPIEFSDWKLKPSYGEAIAWKGKAIEAIKNQRKVVDKPVHLFCKMQSLRHRKIIKYIRLPDCPNIHLFAVTLLHLKANMPHIAMRESQKINVVKRR